MPYWSLSHAHLVAKLHYDYRTGQFTERATGRVAGRVNSKGYITIAFRGRYYRAHSLAWFYIHQVWARGHIHHRNHVKTDNSLANLEDVAPADHVIIHGGIGETTKAYRPVLLKVHRKRHDRINVLLRLLGLLGARLAFYPGASLAKSYQIVMNDLENPVTDRLSLDQVEMWIEEKQEARCAGDISFRSSMAGLKHRPLIGSRRAAEKGSRYARLESADRSFGYRMRTDDW